MWTPSQGRGAGGPAGQGRLRLTGPAGGKGQSLSAPYFPALGHREASSRRSGLGITRRGSSSTWGRRQRLSEMHNARQTVGQQGNRVKLAEKAHPAPRPGQRGLVGLVCQDQNFGLLLSPQSGTLGRGAQSPGQSQLVLSQASGAQHLRGSGRQGLGPGF